LVSFFDDRRAKEKTSGRAAEERALWDTECGLMVREPFMELLGFVKKICGMSRAGHSRRSLALVL
jgi:hypothetical protein